MLSPPVLVKSTRSEGDFHASTESLGKAAGCQAIAESAMVRCTVAQLRSSQLLRRGCSISLAFRGTAGAAASVFAVHFTICTPNRGYGQRQRNLPPQPRLSAASLA